MRSTKSRSKAVFYLFTTYLLPIYYLSITPVAFTHTPRRLQTHTTQQNNIKTNKQTHTSRYLSMQKAVDQLLTIRTTIDDMANGGGGVGGAEPMLLLLESLGFQQVAFLRQVTCCPHSPSHSPHCCYYCYLLPSFSVALTPPLFIIVRSIVSSRGHHSHPKSCCCWIFIPSIPLTQTLTLLFIIVVVVGT